MLRRHEGWKETKHAYSVECEMLLCGNNGGTDKLRGKIVLKRNQLLCVKERWLYWYDRGVKK